MRDRHLQLLLPGLDRDRIRARARAAVPERAVQIELVAQRLVQRILLRLLDELELLGPLLLRAGGGVGRVGRGVVVAFGVPGEIFALLPAADGYSEISGRESRGGVRDMRAMSECPR